MSTQDDGTSPNARRRITRDERERAIVQGAINYFAEVGFAGQMRALAERIGVSLALLFKHFVTKDALIDRVYEEVYLKRWNPAWELMLDDRRAPVKERLVRFYDSYVETSSDYQWIRIFMFGSLTRHDINERYLSLIAERIIPRICAAIREAKSLSLNAPYSDEETQAAWGLHGSILYYLIQRNIYGNAHPDARLVVRSRINAFMDGTNYFAAHVSDLARSDVAVQEPDIRLPPLRRH
jgi:AcrR family transcriptional regulator